MSDFTSIAKSRARYYCKNAPVQFIMVELLRMGDTSDVIVTLQFKNIAPQPLTAFTAHFRCKDANGQVVMEEDFTYSGLQVQEGDSFGADDAVYVSAVPLSSVEVNLVRVQYGEAPAHDLSKCAPVPLPALKPLPTAVAALARRALQIPCEYMPAAVEGGWQCACGAFNPNAGKSALGCSECGVNKNDLQSAMMSALDSDVEQMQARQQAVPTLASMPQHGRDTVESIGSAASAAIMSSLTLDDFTQPAASAADLFDENAPTAVIPPRKVSQVIAYSAADPLGEYDGEDDDDRGPAVSIFSPDATDFIIKVLPLLTLGACGLYVLLAWLFQMLLG